MKNERVFEEKLELLKLELNILNARINQLLDNAWKIRHICLTLWLAGLSLGLGALSQGNKPIIEILLLSTIIPIVFLLIDAKETNWYFRYEFRDSEIREFMNLKDYILPSTEKRISFEECLSEQVFRFPVYDLTGSKTLGDDKLYLWHTKSLWSFLATPVPLFYYSLQIFVSIFFWSLELNKKGVILLWWLLPLLLLFLISSLAVMANFKIRKLKQKRITNFYRILNEEHGDRQF